MPLNIKLRAFVEEDIARLVEILNKSEVNQFLSTKIPTPYTDSDAAWWVSTGSKIGSIRAIEYQGQLIGCIGVNPGEFEYARSGEIGYWIDSAFWRQGVVTQAITILLEDVFSHTDLIKVFACVFSDNVASQGALLKSGFHHEATLKRAMYKEGQFYDNWVFAIFK